MTYAQHFSTKKTPQNKKADPRQVENSAGGFSFQIDKWQQLQRFLILGNSGGSYYAGEREMTIENAGAVIACLDEGGPRTVATIVEISDKGRAPKNDPAIFALAIAAGHANPATRKAALEALPKVCRIGTHLFQFLEAVRNFRGGGRGLRTAVAKWYESHDAKGLAYQVTKYQQRNGVSHRDVFRLMRCETGDPEKQRIYRWVVAGAEGMGARTVVAKPKTDGKAREYGPVGELPTYLAAFEELKKTTDNKRICALVREHNFSHEMLPTESKNSVDVWEALLERMPMTAMIRNLAKMTAVGLVKPMGEASKTIAERLGNVDLLRKARVHPVALLSALMVYQQGHGERGSLTWKPEREIVDALDAAFYLSFDTIDPTGKRILLAIDVSGSMDGGTIAGVPGLTPRLGAAAMAMVTARTEKRWHCVGFSSGAPGEYRHGNGRSAHSQFYGMGSGLTELAISPRQRLDDVVRTMQAVPMGGTDCALPMLYADAKGLEVDCFVIATDSETWANPEIHPHQALVQYRNKTGINAKMAVLAFVANEFSIANPTDPNEIDFVGFDTLAPSVLANFIRE